MQHGAGQKQVGFALVPPGGPLPQEERVGLRGGLDVRGRVDGKERRGLRKPLRRLAIVTRLRGVLIFWLWVYVCVMI